MQAFLYLCTAKLTRGKNMYMEVVEELKKYMYREIVEEQTSMTGIWWKYIVSKKLVT